MPADSLAEEVWWERYERAADAKRQEGPAGSKLMTDHCHDVLDLIGLAAEGLEIVAGVRGWQSVPPERRTEEYVQRETLRLFSELGRRLGVGPMP